MSNKKKNYRKYYYLLKEGESALPAEVRKTIDFFSSNNIWFHLSRNSEARSCREAASRRFRLGHIGIPLEHELKSYFGKFINAAGVEQYVVLHCKGNQELDFDKVNKVLEAKLGVERLEIEDLHKIFSFENGYGLVNPFNLDPRFLDTHILQVFDRSLTENNRSPYTMMTNAGDLTWAVEFKPSQLIETIKHPMVEDIIRVDDTYESQTPPWQQKIGIITGNAPESGILLWQKINQFIREKSIIYFYGDISFPHVIVESIPDMGLSMELDIREHETWDALKKGIISLCKQGATILCIACNTTQYFTPEIRKITKQYGTRFISIPDVTFDYLEKNSIKEFALLGVKYVTGLNEKWSAFKPLRKFKVETLLETTIQQIHNLAFRVKNEGITEAGLNKLRDLLNASTKSKNIVIALTELSLLLSPQKKRSRKGRKYIDTLELLAEAAADEYLYSTKSQ